MHFDGLAKLLPFDSRNVLGAFDSAEVHNNCCYPSAECHTTWFTIMHCLGKMDRLCFLSITNIVFHSDRIIDMLPAWECIRRCTRRMETLEQVRFEKCYSVHKPHRISWPMGARHLIQFSRQEQDELQYYVRRNLERRYKLVRLRAPEMLSRTSSSSG